MVKFTIKMVRESFAVDTIHLWEIKRGNKVMMVSKIYYRYAPCLKAAQEFAKASKLKLEL